MVSKNNKEELDQLVWLFKDLFINRSDRLAKQTPSIYTPVDIEKGGLVKALRDHLNHNETYGSYAYSNEGMSKWLCIDIDLLKGLDLDQSRVELLHAARIIKQYLIDYMEVKPEAIRIEFSGGKGFHVWVFLAEPVHVYRIQSFWRKFMEKLPPIPPQVEQRLERFPHQETDPRNKPYGSLVKMPCCKHQKSGSYSYFVNDEGNEIDPLITLSSVQKWCLPEEYECISPPKDVTQQRAIATRTKVHVKIITPEEEPPLNGDIKRAFMNCSLLTRFKEDPSDVSYQEWRAAGISLTMMGKEGEAWFRWLSYMDESRWDHSHQELIDKVNNGVIKHPPACDSKSSYACSGCPFKSPIEAMAKSYANRYKPVWIGDREKPYYIELNELRQRQNTSVKQVIDSECPGVYLLNSPVGAGKTNAACGVIQKTNKRALWFAPNNHEQAEEILHKFGDQAMCIYGRDYMVEHMGFVCPHHADLKHVSMIGVSLEGHYCHHICPKREMCEYLEQYKEAPHKQVVILMHQHLALRRSRMDVLLEDRDVVVFDECFLPSLRSANAFYITDLQRLRVALISHRDGLKIIRKWIDPLIRLYDEGGCFVLPRLRLNRSLIDMVSMHFGNGEKGRCILGDLIQAMNVTIRIKQIGDVRFYWFVRTSLLPNDKPILVLDASGNVELYRMALGPEYNVKLIDPSDGCNLMKHNIHVTQLVTGTYPNATMIARENEDVVDTGQPMVASKSGEALIKYIRERVRSDEKTGIITTKKFLPILQDALQDLPDIIYGYYKKLRGINLFEDVETLFVVGYQGIEYMEISKQARIWFDQEWDDVTMVKSFDGERDWRWLSYIKHGVGYQVKLAQPTNPYARAFVNDIYAEVDQAVGRIRPYNDTGRQRRIFIMTNIPVSIEVDEIGYLDDEQKDRAYEKIIAAATELLHEQEQFTFKDLLTKAEVSERTLRTHIKSVCELLHVGQDRRGKTHIFYSAEHAIEFGGDEVA